MNPPIRAFAIIFGAGLATGLVVLIPVSVVVLLVSVAVVSTARGSRTRGTMLVAFAIGTSVGAVTARDRRAGCAARWSPGKQAAILRLHDAPDARGRAQATVMHSPAGCAGTVRIRVGEAQVRSGATIVAAGVVRWGNVYSVDHFRVLDRRPGLRYRIRDRVARRIDALYGQRSGLVAALVLGRRGDISPALRARFVESGLAHLLAISGLHVGILSLWLGFVARLVGAGRHTWAYAAAGVWIYVAMLGFPAPAFRAAWFITLYGTARIRQRHPSPTTILAVAAFAIVAVTPGAITSVGAWLSFGALWGTASALRAAPRARGVARLVVVSIGATLATAPITALTFGSVAPVGVVANLVAIPLAGVAVPAVFGSLVAGGVLAGAAGVALTGIERVAALGAAIPGGHLNGDPGVGFALPWVLLVSVATWIVYRRPAWTLVRWRLLAGAAVLSWAFVALDHLPIGSTTGLTLYVLDVGQGDAIVLRTPHGRWVLVDAGPRTLSGDAGRRVVVPFLRRHGVRALDLVILSHGDADHLGGIPAVLGAVPVGRVMEPGQPLGTELYLEHLGAVAEAGAQWSAARAGDTLIVDGVTLVVLHPDASWLARELRPNENSVVVRVTFGRFDALLSGDIGWPAESLLIDDVQRVELLKVGHHGSAGSSYDAWLDAVRPKVAVISVGRNGYGHPAGAVLQRLRARGVTVYRTDRGGTVTIRSDGRYFEVTQGGPNPLLAEWSCQVRRWLQSRVSSSNRSDCTPKRRGSSPTSFTTWRSPPRISPPM